MTFHRFAVVFLAGLFVFDATAPLFAQTSRRSAPPATNPFAQRAARETAQNAAAPAETSRFPLVPTDSAESPAADVLVLKRGERLDGAVEKLSGLDGVSFRVAGENSSRNFAFAEIERLEFAASPEFRAGNAAFESARLSGTAADYRRALAAFQEARQVETRRPLRELATAKIVETLSALGRDDDAANEFFVLARLDPFSAFLPTIPLRWAERSALKSGPTSEQTENAAASWLAAQPSAKSAPNPVARLLAASILLNSAKYKDDAVAALRELVVCEPPTDAAASGAPVSADATQTCQTISLLATAQLWRLALRQTPTDRELARWEKTAELLPNELRLGPTFLVARAAASKNRDDAAALAFLRVALLSPSRTLAEIAAEEAADSLEKRGKTPDAERLRADFEARFAD